MPKSNISYSGILGLYLALDRPEKIIFCGIFICFMPIYLDVLIFLGIQTNLITSILVTAAIGAPILFIMGLVFMAGIEPLANHIIMIQAAVKQAKTWDENSDTVFYLSLTLASTVLTITGLVSVFYAYFFSSNVNTVAMIIGIPCAISMISASIIRFISIRYLSKSPHELVLGDTLHAAREARTKKDLFIVAKVMAKNTEKEAQTA